MLPAFGRRPTDTVIDTRKLFQSARTSAPASSDQPFCFADLDYLEILVPHGGGEIQLRRFQRGQKGLWPIDDRGRATMEALRAAISDAFASPDRPADSPRFISHEGVRFKAVPIETTTGRLYLCRRVRPIPDFAALEGIEPSIRNHLDMLGRTHENGLVVVSGLPGSGKTTMMMALMLHLTETLEDVAVLVESQPEIRLSGLIHGSQGRVVQVRPVTDPSRYDDYLRSLLELSPRLAAVGSVATALDARLVLDLAMAGTLVLTTINASDILGAIGIIINHVSSVIGTAAARDATALSLRGVMHQSLGEKDSSPEPDMRKLKLTSLFLPGSNGNQAMMRKIKNDRIQELSSDVALQATRIQGNEPPLDHRDLNRPENSSLA